jgi:hypothetical protein
MPTAQQAPRSGAGHAARSPPCCSRLHIGV